MSNAMKYYTHIKKDFKFYTTINKCFFTTLSNLSQVFSPSWHSAYRPWLPFSWLQHACSLCCFVEPFEMLRAFSSQPESALALPSGITFDPHPHLPASSLDLRGAFYLSKAHLPGPSC